MATPADVVPLPKGLEMELPETSIKLKPDKGNRLATCSESERAATQNVQRLRMCSDSERAATEDSSSVTSFGTEGSTLMPLTTLWSVWRSGPLARHFLREWAKESTAFKARSSEARAISRALLKLAKMDDDGPALEAPVQPLADASSSTFLGSPHGKAFKAVQRMAREVPRMEHFTTPQIIARGGYGAVFHATHRASNRVYAIKRQPLQQLGGLKWRRPSVDFPSYRSARLPGRPMWVPYSPRSAAQAARQSQEALCSPFQSALKTRMLRLPPVHPSIK